MNGRGIEYYRKIKNILKVILFYIIGLILVNAIFYFIYSKNNNVTIQYIPDQSIRISKIDYLYFSLITFFSIGYGDFAPLSEAGKVVVIVEGVIGSIYSFVFAGIFVYVSLNPVNPIVYAKNFLIDTKENKVIIRYRICYRSNRFLNEVTAKVSILRRGELNNGVSYASIYEKSFEYSLIRGVRYITLDYSDNKLKKAIESLSYIQGRKNLNDIILEVMITGKDEKGHTITKKIEYNKRHLKVGYVFISIRRSEAKKDRFLKDKREKIMYNNFNKIKKI